MLPKVLFPVGETLVSITRLMKHRHLDGSIRFLVYHSVMPRHHNLWIPESNIWLDDFENQINFIVESGFKVISMPEALSYMQQKRKLKERMICLTFDDGFRNNFTIVWPVLRRFGFSAHFAITAESVDKKGPYHWDIWRKGDERTSNPDLVDHHLLPLSAAEIRQLIQEGATIGSHGFTHRRLTQLADAELNLEIEESAKALESVSGHKIRTFIYPFGDFNRSIMGKVIKRYDWAFSVKLGRINPSKMFNPHEIHRTSTLNDLRLSQFRTVVFGGLDFIRLKDKFSGNV